MAVVEYEVKDRLAYITLNRPDKLNALNQEVLEGIDDAIHSYQQDPDAWVAILSGRGRAFCTGAILLGSDPERAGEDGAPRRYTR